MSLPPIKNGIKNSSKSINREETHESHHSNIPIHSVLNRATKKDKGSFLNIKSSMGNLNNKSLNFNNKDYYNKLFTLLKKKDKNYSKKRNNIQNTEYSIDENNNLYLTLPKISIHGKNKSKQVKKNFEDKRIEDAEEISNQAICENKNSSEDNLNISDLGDTFSDSCESDLNEEQKLKLFEKLRTKNNFISNELHQDKYLKLRSENSRTSLLIPRSSPSNSIILKKNNSISEKNILAKNKSLSSLIDDPLLQNIQKLVEKLRLIRTQNKSRKGKKKIPAADFFYYDKKKWADNKMSESNMILIDLKEFKVNRDAAFKKLFLSPNINIKVDDILKIYKKGV